MIHARRSSVERAFNTRQAAETRERLVAAAEHLFAAHGYTNVSVRAIAAAAGVNWSLVGYHFRGKEGLLSEVYRRHCATLNRERLRLLGLAGRGRHRLERTIEAFVRPALTEIHTPAGDGGFSRIRAILAAEDSTLLTQLVARNFDRSSRTFVAALADCLPDVPPDEILWRFHFMLGTIYYSVSSPQRIKTFSKGRCDPGNVEDTLRHLVPFLAAAFRAPSPPGKTGVRPGARSGDERPRRNGTQSSAEDARSSTEGALLRQPAQRRRRVRSDAALATARRQPR